MTERLVLSVAEAAEVLHVSDDLVYELTERGELPCLRLGRRKVIPRKAVEQLVEFATDGFDPSAAFTSLRGTTSSEEVRRRPTGVDQRRASPRSRTAPARHIVSDNGINAPLSLFADGESQD